MNRTFHLYSIVIFIIEFIKYVKKFGIDYFTECLCQRMFIILFYLDRSCLKG